MGHSGRLGRLGAIPDGTHKSQDGCGPAKLGWSIRWQAPRLRTCHVRLDQSVPSRYKIQGWGVGLLGKLYETVLLGCSSCWGAQELGLVVHPVGKAAASISVCVGWGRLQVGLR